MNGFYDFTGSNSSGPPSSYLNYLASSSGSSDFLNSSQNEKSWLNNSLSFPPELRYQSLNEMVSKIIDEEAQKSLMASGNSLNLSLTFSQFKKPQQTPQVQQQPQLEQSKINFPFQQTINMPLAFPSTFSHQLATLSIDQQNYLLQQQTALFLTLDQQNQFLINNNNNNCNNNLVLNTQVSNTSSSSNEAQIGKISPQFQISQQSTPVFRNHRRTGPANELHVRLEECIFQFKTLEAERKKIETELFFLNLNRRYNNNIQLNSYRLPPNPSRVDRLINESYKEYNKLINLLNKIDNLKNTIFFMSINQNLENLLNGIKNVELKRKEELFNNMNKQRLNKNGNGNGNNNNQVRISDEKDIIELANSINSLTLLACKTRTALWCALQISNVNYNLKPGESLFDSLNKTKDFIQKTFEIKTDLELV